MAKMEEHLDIELRTELADAIRTAADLGARASRMAFQPTMEKFNSDEKKDYYIQHLDPALKAEIVEHDRPQRDRQADFYSLDSFVHAIHDETTLGNPGVHAVYIDKEAMYGLFNQGGHERKTQFKMELEHTEQYKAFLKITKGVGRQELWQLLATDLYGCLPAGLEFQIMNLRMYEDSKQEITIQPTGLKTGQASNAVKICYDDPKEGKKDLELGLDFTYKGTVWTCFDDEIQVPMRLVVSNTAEGLHFRFFPRGLGSLLIAHHGRLSNEVAEMLSELDCAIPVYQGSA